MSIPELSVAGAVGFDPTVPAPMTNVAEYGFEGRFEDWAGDAFTTPPGMWHAHYTRPISPLT